MRTARAGCVSTILPLSVLCTSRVGFVRDAGADDVRRHGAVVPGDHAFGIPMIGITRGAVIVA